MFHKTKKATASKAVNKPASRSLEILSVIAKDTHMLGTLLSDGSIDFDGTLDGNVRAHMLTVRKNGVIKGDITADVLHVYGKIDGIVRAKTVHLYKNCHVEGIVMHETITIEDGAFMDGKCKRTDRATLDDDDYVSVLDNPAPSSFRMIN